MKAQAPLSSRLEALVQYCSLEVRHSAPSAT